MVGFPDSDEPVEEHVTDQRAFAEWYYRDMSRGPVQPGSSTEAAAILSGDRPKGRSKGRLPASLVDRRLPLPCEYPFAYVYRFCPPPEPDLAIIPEYDENCVGGASCYLAPDKWRFICDWYLDD